MQRIRIIPERMTDANPLKYNEDEAKKLVEELKIQDELQKAILRSGAPASPQPTTITTSQPSETTKPNGAIRRQ